MAKITKVDRKERETVVIKTKVTADPQQGHKWWTAKSKAELSQQVIETAAFLKDTQQFRYRQASIHARMYGNLPLANFAGASFSKLSAPNSLPLDRPTMNVVQSCIDTLVSRITQSKPRPQFLTDEGDYVQRGVAKQMNRFIAGEFYSTHAYELGEQAFRDGSILGTGCLHVYESDDNKVALERVLLTELLVDPNDAFYGMPRSMYRLKLVDRSVVAQLFPDQRSKVESAEQAYPDSTAESQKSTADQVMLVEAWHLPSSKNATDGRHTIACTSGVLFDEEYKCSSFPFVFFHYSPRLVGFWSQGLSEQLAGTQIEINKLLVTISKSINLVGVPRVFVEEGSKVVKAHLNDQIGAIVTYRGTKPIYEVAPCVPAELYQQLQRLVDYAYQQSGISALAATSQKPAGLNSGEAIRNYDDLQSDRFATVEKRYRTFYEDLSYKMIELACDIAERDGKYSTVYPTKDGTREIDLPKIREKDDPFVIQCFDSSSLPRDPAGRMQTIVEWMQAGIIDAAEGRRLLDAPDLGQVNRLAFAAEERIFQMLDDIVEHGKYTPPDPFTDLQLALKYVSQYYNLYTAAKLPESKAEMLRSWQSQCLMLQQAAQPPAPMPVPGQPQAVPEAPPVSTLLPNTPH